MKRPGKGAPSRPIGGFVSKLTQKAFEKYGFATAAVAADWAIIVGPKIAARTLPEQLKWPRRIDAYANVEDGQAGRPGATLVLRVDPAFALDVQYQIGQIIERLNTYFGYRAIAEIRIVQGRIDATGAKSGLPPAAADSFKSHRPGPNAGTAAVDLSGLDNEKLRAALERLEQNVARENR